MSSLFHVPPPPPTNKMHAALSVFMVHANLQETLGPMLLMRTNKYFYQLGKQWDRDNVRRYLQVKRTSYFQPDGGLFISNERAPDAIVETVYMGLPDGFGSHGTSYSIISPITYTQTNDPNDEPDTVTPELDECREYRIRPWRAGVPHGEIVTVHTCENDGIVEELLCNTYDNGQLNGMTFRCRLRHNPAEASIDFHFAEIFLENGHGPHTSSWAVVPVHKYCLRRWAKVCGGNIDYAQRAFDLYMAYMVSPEALQQSFHRVFVMSDQQLLDWHFPFSK